MTIRTARKTPPPADSPKNPRGGGDPGGQSDDGGSITDTPAPAEGPSPQEAPAQDIPAEVPAANPADNPADNPVDIPAEVPAANPADIPSENPAANPADSPAENPAANPADNPADIPGANPAENPADIPAVNPTDIPTDFPAPQEAPAQNNPAETPAVEGANDSASLFEFLYKEYRSLRALSTVHAQEEGGGGATQQETVTDTRSTVETTELPVTWELDPLLSDAAVFSSGTAGAVFVYRARISGEIAARCTIAEGVEAPLITVTIADAKYPAQTFSANAGYLHVEVTAEEGAFPEGTSMKAVSVSREKVMEAAQEAIDADTSREGEVVDALAADITFYNKQGEELQPAIENGVHVTLTALRKLTGQEQDVAHIEHLTDPAQETQTTILESHETDISADMTEQANGDAAAENVVAEFDAEHFSVYAIIGTNGAQTGDTVRRIYEYYTSENDTDYVLHERQIYKNGDILLEPALPKRNDGKYFIGWYSGDGSGHAGGEGVHASMVFDEPITDIDETRETDEVIKVHAHFSTEIIVRFYNASFADVIEIEEGQPGEVISLSGPRPQLTSSELHIGWMLVNNSGNPVDLSGNVLGQGDELFNGTNGSFTGILSSYTWYEPDETITLGTTNIYLRAIISESHKLEFFENNGSDDPDTHGSYTAPVYVPHGNSAQGYMPSDPVREGYTFGGWYFDEDCTDANLFDATVVTSTEYASKADAQGVIKLYAKWTAAQTTYDVYIWREVLTNGIRETDPAKKKYEAVLFYTGDTAYSGTPGTMAAWTDALRTAFEASPDATSSRDDDKAFDYRYYQYNESKTTPVLIRGDGSTILNVYYDLKEFTLTFYPEYRTTTTAGRPAYYYGEFMVNGVTYDRNNPYSVNVVLGQYTADGTWPLPSGITNVTGIYEDTGETLTGNISTASTVMFAWGSHADYGNAAGKPNSYLGGLAYVVKKRISKYDGTPADHTLTAVVYTKSRTQYALKKAYLETNDDTYTYDSRYDYKGLVPTNSNPTAYNVIGYTLEREVKIGGSGTEADPVTWECYYKRRTNTVTLHNYNDIYETDLIKFGEAIPTNGDDYIKQNASAADLTNVNDPPVPGGLGDHYEFEGWYENRAYTIPFDFTENHVMGEENITLYAKWVPKEITITFDAGEGSFAADAADGSNRIELTDAVDVGGETRYKKATVTATAGETLGNIIPENPEYSMHTFRDWLLNGTRVDFTQREFLDNTELEASWHDEEEVTVYYFKTEDQANALNPSTPATVNAALGIYAGGAKSRNYRYDAHLAVLDGTTDAGNNAIPGEETIAGVTWTFVGWRAVGSGLTTYLPGELISITPGASMIRVFNAGTNDEKDTIAFYAVYESIAQQETTITCYSNYPDATGFGEETHTIDKNSEQAEYKNEPPTEDLLVNYETKAPAESDLADVFPTNGGNVNGYTFTGWNTKADGSGTAIAAGASIAADLTAKENYTDSVTDPQINRLYAQWTPNLYSYTIRHVVPNLSNAAEYDTLDSYTRTAHFNETVSAVAHSFEGMELDWTTTKTKAGEASQAWRDSEETGGNTTDITGITTGTPQTVYGLVAAEDPAVADDGLVLTLYYKRQEFKVIYAFEGHVPAAVSSLLQNGNYNGSLGGQPYSFGQTVTINDEDITLSGDDYTFGGWFATDVTPKEDAVTNVRTFTMPNHDVHLTGHFTPKTDRETFYVHHYVEMRQDEIDAVSGLSSIAGDGNDGRFMKVPADATDYNYVTYRNVGGKLYQDGVLPVNRAGTALETASAPARSFRGYTFNAQMTQEQMKTAAVENDSPERMQSPSQSGGEDGLGIAYDNGTSAVSGNILEPHNGQTGNGPLVLQLFYDINRYELTYQYEGTVPAGAPQVPDTSGTLSDGTGQGNYHAFGETVSIKEAPVVPGYTFHGWHTLSTSTDLTVTDEGTTFVMPARSVILRGSFEVNTDTPYTVWYFGEALAEEIDASQELTAWANDGNRADHNTVLIDGGTYCYYNNKVYKLLDSPGPQTLTGVTNSTVKPAASVPGGFTSAGAVSGSYDGTGTTPSFTNPATYSAATGVTIAGSGQTQVRFFYDRNKYKVTYVYDPEKNEAPESDMPAVAGETAVPYGKTVTKAKTADYANQIPGYTFHGWDRAYSTEDLSETTDSTGVTTFKMPARDVLFNAYYTAADVKYRTQYFKELLDESPEYEALKELADTEWSTDEYENSTYTLNGTPYYKANNTYYRLEETVPGTAKMATNVTAEQKTYPGFTYDTVSDNTSSGTVTAALDSAGVPYGTLTLKMYYDIDRNRLVYLYAGDIPQGANALLPQGKIYEYGHHIQVNAGSAKANGYDNTGNRQLAVRGYVFHGWMTEYDYYSETGNMPNPAPQELHVATDGRLEMPDRSTVLYGYFTPASDTPYKVEHYRMELDGTYPDAPQETETLQGTTNKTVSAVHKAYPGFSYDEMAAAHVESGVVTADGSLVLKLYYARESYDYSYEITKWPPGVTGTVPEGADEIVYGSTVTLVQPSGVYQGYHFEGWHAVAGGRPVSVDTDAVTGEQTMKMPAADARLTGAYEPNTDTPYTIRRFADSTGDGTFDTNLPVETKTGTTDTTATLAGNELNLSLAAYQPALAKTLEGFTNGSLTVGAATADADITDGTYTKGTGAEQQTVTVSGGVITAVSARIKADGGLVFRLYYKKKPQEQNAGTEGNGRIETRIEIAPGAPVDSVTGLTVEVARNELTQQELAEDVRTDGDIARIWLEIEPLDESQVPADDPPLIRDAAQLKLEGGSLKTQAGDPAGILYMDISLHKRVLKTDGTPVVSDTPLEYFGDTEEGTQAETGNQQTPYDGKTVRVTVVVPDSIAAGNPPAAGMRREYAIFRVHQYQGVSVDGKAPGKIAEKLAGWTTDTTLTFDTGLFSTYALVWRDVPIRESGTPDWERIIPWISWLRGMEQQTGGTQGTAQQVVSQQTGTAQTVSQQTDGKQGAVQQTDSQQVNVRTGASGQQEQNARNALTGDRTYEKLAVDTMVFLLAFVLLLEQLRKLYFERVRH